MSDKANSRERRTLPSRVRLPRIFAAVRLSVLAMLLASSGPVEASGLGAVETLVSWRYHVTQIDAHEMQQLMTQKVPLIFDVRTPDEYAVSHLPGAIRVEPEMSSKQFLADFGDHAKGRILVFYCSVGVRSSSMADRVAKDIEAAGALQLYNLRGGIFRWNGERLPLENTDGPTDWVHPYSDTWGPLAPRQDRLSRLPQSQMSRLVCITRYTTEPAMMKAPLTRFAHRREIIRRICSSRPACQMAPACSCHLLPRPQHRAGLHPPQSRRTQTPSPN